MITGYELRNMKGGFDVYINGRILDPARSQALVNHSPDGFAWGYSGSGAAQLALALLLELQDDEDFALREYQNLKTDIIAGLDQLKFHLHEDVIRKWIKDRKAL